MKVSQELKKKILHSVVSHFVSEVPHPRWTYDETLNHIGEDMPVWEAYESWTDDDVAEQADAITMNIVSVLRREGGL